MGCGAAKLGPFFLQTKAGGKQQCTHDTHAQIARLLLVCACAPPPLSLARASTHIGARRHAKNTMASARAAPWRVDFDNLAVLDKKGGALDPPGWDAAIAKEPVRARRGHRDERAHLLGGVCACCVLRARAHGCRLPSPGCPPTPDRRRRAVAQAARPRDAGEEASGACGARRRRARRLTAAAAAKDPFLCARAPRAQTCTPLYAIIITPRTPSSADHATNNPGAHVARDGHGAGNTTVSQSVSQSVGQATTRA